MRVTVIGSGYVGLVTGACLAEMGNAVVCLDNDRAKVRMLQGGELPIHEPGLGELIARNTRAGRIAFTDDAAAAIARARIVVIGVGTPAAADGAADLGHVFAAAEAIGLHAAGDLVVVDKSTVPVGTAARVEETIRRALAARGVPHRVAVVSNPEFLKEGAAVDDFMRPDRVVLGGGDLQALDLLRALYAPFVRNRDRILVMDAKSAELTKYAANAMLATRISFMNEMARVADALGADIEAVRRGIGSDPRIGTHFLYAGAGYGGSCFPKDVSALVRSADDAGVGIAVLPAVAAANERQKRVLAEKIVARFGAGADGRLDGRTFAIWGLAFKPETDDLRGAPALVLIDELLVRGAAVQAYDPVAMPEARVQYADEPRVRFADRAHDALEGADALVVVTEWKEFKSPDLEAIARRLREPVLFDGRNLYDPAVTRTFGIEHHGIGRAGATQRANTA